MSTVSPPTALVIEDDSDVREVIGDILRDEGMNVSLARNGAEGLAKARQQTPAVVFTDLRMPGMDGIAVLEQTRCLRPRPATVILTGYGGLDTCMEALRLGACDYVLKPFTAEVLHASLTRALACYRSQEGKNGAPERSAVSLVARSGASPAGQDGELLAHSSAMREIRDLLARIAPSDMPVLIQGEVGVEKEQVAHELHRLSRRAAGPFVTACCGATPEAELGKALYGWDSHEADDPEPARPGWLELAHEGTLFLDDLEKLPLWAQAGLFDALRRGYCQRQGGGRLAACQARLVAATSENLEKAVTDGRLHQGLYYFVKVAPLWIPPLRQRQQDVQTLAQYFLARARSAKGLSEHDHPRSFSSEAWESLVRYDWPGNVFELASVVAHAVVFTDTEEIPRVSIEEALRKAHHHQGAETIALPLVGSLKEIERYVIETVIRRCRGNKAAAARTLGLHRRTLYRMLSDEPETSAGVASAE